MVQDTRGYHKNMRGLLLFLPVVVFPLTAQSNGADVFESKIRPVLVAKCYACHSSKLKSPMSGLVLDTKAGLQAETTLAILEKLNAAPGVLVTKGCGAMGADTVLAIIDNEYRTEFFHALRELKLHPIATSLDLVHETKLKIEP